MKPNWNFQRVNEGWWGGGVQTKNPTIREVLIFSGTSHYHFKIIALGKIIVTFN